MAGFLAGNTGSYSPGIPTEQSPLDAITLISDQFNEPLQSASAPTLYGAFADANKDSGFILTMGNGTPGFVPGQGQTFTNPSQSSVAAVAKTVPFSVWAIGALLVGYWWFK